MPVELDERLLVAATRSNRLLAEEGDRLGRWYVDEVSSTRERKRIEDAGLEWLEVLNKNPGKYSDGELLAMLIIGHENDDVAAWAWWRRVLGEQATESRDPFWSTLPFAEAFFFAAFETIENRKIDQKQEAMPVPEELQPTPEEEDEPEELDGPLVTEEERKVLESYVEKAPAVSAQPKRVSRKPSPQKVATRNAASRPASSRSRSANKGDLAETNHEAADLQLRAVVDVMNGTRDECRDTLAKIESLVASIKGDPEVRPAENPYLMRLYGAAATLMECVKETVEDERVSKSLCMGVENVADLVASMIDKPARAKA